MPGTRAWPMVKNAVTRLPLAASQGTVWAHSLGISQSICIFRCPQGHGSQGSAKAVYVVATEPASRRGASLPSLGCTHRLLLQLAVLGTGAKIQGEEKGRLRPHRQPGFFQDRRLRIGHMLVIEKTLLMTSELVHLHTRHQQEKHRPFSASLCPGSTLTIFISSRLDSFQSSWQLRRETLF